MNMFRPLSILLCAVLLVMAVPAQAAELKVGIIDLKKVFEGYYKTRLANAALEDEVNGLRKDNKALVEDHTKAVDDYKKAMDEANNQAISADEREKRKKEAEGKLIKINDLRQTIEQFSEKKRITQEKILNEIKEAITAKSKAAGFTLVLDTSSADPQRLPTVLYSSGENDLTAVILDHLNANAPPDLPKLDGKKDEKK
jgi:outer membrane protein